MNPHPQPASKATSLRKALPALLALTLLAGRSHAASKTEQPADPSTPSDLQERIARVREHLDPQPSVCPPAQDASEKDFDTLWWRWGNWHNGGWHNGGWNNWHNWPNWHNWGNW
jgi:hypothetical protein